ncbi:hypothetical protein ACWENQ_44760 [Nonomuraea sp. NPDC004354]
MFVTYKPEDGSTEAQTWVFDPSRVRASRAEMIEKRAGENWDMWLQSVQQGNMRARRVLLWHLMSLPHPGMRYEDTPDFFAGELEVQHSAAELAEMRERVAKTKLPDDQAAQILAVLDAELEAARERETQTRLDLIDRQLAEAEGKAPSKSGDAGTRSPSRKSSASDRGSSETS